MKAIDRVLLFSLCIVLSVSVCCAHGLKMSVDSQASTDSKPTLGGPQPLTYTGKMRCSDARAFEIPDGEVCAFIYSVDPKCDLIVSMPADDGTHNSVIGYVCKEDSGYSNERNQK